LNIVAGAEGISSTHEIFQNGSSLQILPGEEEDKDSNCTEMFLSFFKSLVFCMYSWLHGGAMMLLGSFTSFSLVAGVMCGYVYFLGV
jgi:hypothetical protein